MYLSKYIMMGITNGFEKYCLVNGMSENRIDFVVKLYENTK